MGVCWVMGWTQFRGQRATFEETHHRVYGTPEEYNPSQTSQANHAKEKVNTKKVLVLAWISIGATREMPWILSKALASTKLAEFDAVHLLTYSLLLFIDDFRSYSFPLMSFD